MSFFNDFLQSVSVDDVQNKICCDLIFGVSVRILGAFKIDNLGEDEILLGFGKSQIKIIGQELKIVSLAKGELEVAGNVNGVVKLWMELWKLR